MKNTKLTLNLSYRGQCTKHVVEETQILLKKKKKNSLWKFNSDLLLFSEMNSNITEHTGVQTHISKSQQKQYTAEPDPYNLQVLNCQEKIVNK